MTYRLIYLLDEYHLSFSDDEYLEKVFASTDELILFNKDINRLDKSQIRKLVSDWKKTASIDEIDRWWWIVNVKEKMECRNVECDGSCLECNNVNLSIDIQDNTIIVEKIV